MTAAPSDQPIPAEMPPVIERQIETMQAMRNYYLEHRFYPTQREILDVLRVRSTNASAYLKPLLVKGYATKTDGPRGVKLTPLAFERLKIEEEQTGFSLK